MLKPLDRYVLGAFFRIFAVTALGFPLLVIIIDLTDSLDTYLGREIPARDVAMSYLYFIPESLFMILPASVLFATVFTIGSDDTQLVTFGDGDFEPAFGLFGGGDGTLNSITLTYPDGRAVTPRNKDLITGVPRGTVYRQQAGGGGGYGDPRRRDRATLRREVRDGVISPQAARERYGLDER